jgi:hypothetical protein
LKVSAPSGDFEVLIINARAEGDSVCLKAQVGVWDSLIFLNSSDLWSLTRMLLQPSVILLLLKLSLKSLMGKNKSG